jgi:hypothetical protein
LLMAKLDPVGLSALSGCTCPSCANVRDPRAPDTGWNLGRSQPGGPCGAPSCRALPQSARSADQ